MLCSRRSWRLKDNLTLSSAPATAGRPALGWWQWGEQRGFVTPHLLLCSLVFGAGVPCIMGFLNHPSPTLLLCQIQLPLLQGDIIHIIPSPLAWMQEGAGSEPHTAALPMLIAPCTCRKGKKQLRPNPRCLIHHWPKYAVLSGDWVVFPVPLKVHCETKENKTL